MQWDGTTSRESATMHCNGTWPLSWPVLSEPSAFPEHQCGSDKAPSESWTVNSQIPFSVCTQFWQCQDLESAYSCTPFLTGKLIAENPLGVPHSAHTLPPSVPPDLSCGKRWFLSASPLSGPGKGPQIWDKQQASAQTYSFTKHPQELYWGVGPEKMYWLGFAK